MLSLSDCSPSTSTSNTNIAAIKTTGIDTVEFELQFPSTGWIAIGISESQSMPDAYIFLCYSDSGERKSDSQSLPPVVASALTTIASSISGGIINCKFTSPISRVPQLNNPTGYYVLLVRGTMELILIIFLVEDV